MFNFENINESRNPEDIMQQQYDDPIKNAIWNYVAGYTTTINNILRKGKTNILTKDLDEAFNEYGDSIEAMCKILGIARSAYYKWLGRESPESEIENVFFASANS